MDATTLNKEQVYDEQISPLMNQVIAICQERGISMLATFALPVPGNEGLACTTALADETGQQPPMHRRLLSVLAAHSDLMKNRETTH